MRICIVAILCFSCQLLSAQQDSSYLAFEKLNWYDIDKSETLDQSTKVISGTRTERNLEDLPFTIFVISAEEIKTLGYHTLVDAIKHLPGIRVSQPGSGVDGESFMMRGLYGNTYAKILINDVPIKPSGVGAMPIGSQLPIRQAERIEVIYGPAATLYGSDAASGVINIILKESEYPTYAQADIEVGQNNHSRLNALFGGKIPVGKKTLKLNMYGGYTSFIDRRIKYNQELLYNPEIYQNLIGQNALENVPYFERPNYVGTIGVTSLSNLPHQSNYIGFSASIGAFEFNTQRLFRSDHSSLGLNPFAVSFADPQSLYGEEILTTSMSFKKKYKKWDFSIRGTGLEYSINPLSSFKYVLPTLGVISNIYVQDEIPLSSIDEGPRKIDSLYLSGPRYVSGNSSDISVDVQANFSLTENIGLSVGLQSLGGFSKDGIERYKELPGNIRNDFVSPTILSNSNFLFSETIAFAEGYFDYGPIKIVLGAQIFEREDSLIRDDAQFNPRLGLLYKIDSTLSTRASFTTAFRYPSSYFSASTYQLNKSDDFINVTSGSIELEPERTISFELGVRYNPVSAISLDASLYYTRTSNYINFIASKSLNWGYRNDANSFSRLYGAQLNLRLNKLWPAIKLTTDINLNYSRGKERVIAVDINDFNTNNLYNIPVIRAQPNFMGYIRMSFNVHKNLKFILNHSIMSTSWTKNKLRITRALNQNDIDSILNNGYYTLEFRTVFSISRQLSAYLNISNLFNTKYAGIDASFEPDVLLYNPQSLRMAMFGVNYSFN